MFDYSNLSFNLSLSFFFSLHSLLLFYLLFIFLVSYIYFTLFDFLHSRLCLRKVQAVNRCNIHISDKGAQNTKFIRCSGRLLCSANVTCICLKAKETLILGWA